MQFETIWILSQCQNNHFFCLGISQSYIRCSEVELNRQESHHHKINSSSAIFFYGLFAQYRGVKKYQCFNHCMTTRSSFAGILQKGIETDFCWHCYSMVHERHHNLCLSVVQNLLTGGLVSAAFNG
jgi:hypothetical protein